MAVKKSELYSTLWKCCDELRGGMDASQYKDYVLVILFVKYISDKSRSDAAFDIEIPDGCYFEDFVALKGNPNIGEEINKKMQKLAEANQLDGVFVADFDDEAKLGKGKDKVETLSKLIAVFQNENLDFSKNRAADVMIINKIDLLPYLHFDIDRCEAYARQVNPDIRILRTSATTKEGLDAWVKWLTVESALCNLV